MRTPLRIAALSLMATATALAADTPASVPAAKPYLTVEALRAKWGDRRGRIAGIGGVDLIKAGIIDPAKVTRSALQNAASIAALFLTTEVVVADKPEKAAPAMPGGDGGMGGMDF